MSQFIEVDRTVSTAVFAPKLISLPKDLRNVLDRLTEIQEMGYQMIGDPPDFTVFETLFGLSTGQGVTVFNLVNGILLASNGEAQNANATEFIARVG